MGMEFIKNQFRCDTSSVVAEVSNHSIDRSVHIWQTIDSEYYFKISSNGNEDTYFALTEKAFCMLLDAMKFIDSPSSFGKHIPLKVDESCFEGNFLVR